MGRRTAVICGCALGVLAVPAAAGAARLPLRELGRGGTAGPAFVRTPDGALHVIYPPANLKGLSAWRIAPGGQVGHRTTVLNGSWLTNEPGLVVLPTGQLEAVFSGGPPQGPATIWGITSGDGGATWVNPTDVTGTPPSQMDVITAQMSGATPVLASGIAGTLTVQRGLGAAAPTLELQTPADADVGEVRSAVDAAGTVVAGWDSGVGSGGDWLQEIAPATGAPQPVPGVAQDTQSVAGSSAGAGVYAPYTTDGRRVRLLRYGGGSVAVGRRSGGTPQFAMGDATGPGGRIWVFWSDGPGRLAVTRSNAAVTRFEPVQRLSIQLGMVYRLWGDGRLGPLDLLVDETPRHGTPDRALLDGRVRPVLSPAVRVSAIRGHRRRVVVRITDAGDPVNGAVVRLAAGRRRTGPRGGATFRLTPRGTRVLRVTAPTYAPTTRRIRLG